MDWLLSMFKTVEPIQYIYGVIAIIGGMARYLTGYADGKHFSLGIFAASAFVSGFSGWMFALIGISMNMPQPVLFIMAGTGGFMGEQTMKLVVEWVQGKIK